MKSAILSSFDSIPYFTIEGVRQLLSDEKSARGSVQTKLYRWMKNGLVIQLKKGVYMTHRFFDLHHADEDFIPAVSAILIPQSYVSLEYRLQQLGMLTEITFPLTAVTLKHTRVIENSLGTFSYRSIQPENYMGFNIAEYMGIPFYRATPAKALFDFFYLHPARRLDLRLGHSVVEDLRLNLENLTQEDGNEFAGYVDLTDSPKMKRILKDLRKTVWLP